MKKVARFLLVFLLVMSICSTALAAYCTNCGGVVNSSFSFCPACGTALNGTASSTSSTSTSSTSTSSTSSTSSSGSSGSGAAPAPAPATSQMEVTSVTDLGKGNTQIAWSDPASNGPYTVCYMMNVSGDFDTDLETTTGLWTAAENVSGKSAVVNNMIPGHACWIIVFDADSNYVVYEHHPLPYNHFPEFGTDISIQLKTRTGSSYREYSSFSSADIAQNASSKAYGAYIRLNYPQLAKARLYNCMVIITNPRGEAIVDTITEMELSSGRSYTYWNFYSLDWYFNILTKYYGRVDPGYYTWTMFYDGMYVNSQQFYISE